MGAAETLFRVRAGPRRNPADDAADQGQGVARNGQPKAKQVLGDRARLGGSAAEIAPQDHERKDCQHDLIVGTFGRNDAANDADADHYHGRNGARQCD